LEQIEKALLDGVPRFQMKAAQYNLIKHFLTTDKPINKTNNKNYMDNDGNQLILNIKDVWETSKEYGLTYSFDFVTKL